MKKCFSLLIVWFYFSTSLSVGSPAWAQRRRTLVIAGLLTQAEQKEPVQPHNSPEVQKKAEREARAQLAEKGLTVRAKL